MVPKHCGPWDSARDHWSGKLGKNGGGIPGCTLSIQLIACEDNQVRFFRIERTFYERFGIRIGAAITRGRRVTAGSIGDREMEVGDLQDFETTIMREMQGRGAWRH